MRVLVIDNYDSFTFNLVQYLGELGAEPIVVRNDELSPTEAAALRPDRLLISPGPGRPEDAGHSIEFVKTIGMEVPTLGVCLGHQAIVVALGGKVDLAPEPKHGKTSTVRHDSRGVFAGLSNPFVATRYHSLAACRASRHSRSVRMERRRRGHPGCPTRDPSALRCSVPPGVRTHPRRQGPARQLPEGLGGPLTRSPGAFTRRSPERPPHRFSVHSLLGSAKMASMTTLAIGTEKGGYLLPDNGRAGRVTGPLFAGWKVTAFHQTSGGDYLACVGSNWFGPAIHRSPDLERWEQLAPGPLHEGGRKLEQIWTLASAGSRIYAGVAEAGLFASEDGGHEWEPVDALNRFEGSERWQPGLGGLAAHHVLTAGDQVWVGISAVGVFRSDDAGRSFTRCDRGVTAVVDESEMEGGGFCVHGIDHDPTDPNHLWRQDHSGVYRSRTGGDDWERIETGLPARFGFVMRRHHPSGRLFVVPLTSDESRVPVDGEFAAYRSDDGGAAWDKAGSGWPSGSAFDTVLRRSVTVHEDSVFMGTTGGRVWVSDDVGDTWSVLPHTFPRILTVDVLG